MIYLVGKAVSLLTSAAMLLSGTGYTEAVAKKTIPAVAMQTEKLDRGLTAMMTSEGVFLSWRFFREDAQGYSDTGLTGTEFEVYRDGKKIAVVSDSTNYLDEVGNSDSVYSVCAVKQSVLLDTSEEVCAYQSKYIELPLSKPEGGITPGGKRYAYKANDMSVGDVDGDGKYEYFVKWQPTNAMDVSIKGYTGNTYIDCYRLDGTLLYRIDLGVNVRSGAHYTQFMVYDFDMDGKAEIIMKTAPGTKTILQNGTEQYITMQKADIDAGYTNADDYRMSADDYYQSVVKLFMTWQDHPEVKNGHWYSTLEECFGIEQNYQYPLVQKDAQALADYFMDVYAPSRSKKNELRKFEGFILSGPEYLTVFKGDTGEEIDTIPYTPKRTDDGLMWGDYAMENIEPGNRVDRFLAGVAYLDGKRPYAVFSRGYYTRSAIASYSFDGKHLIPYWNVDSGWTIMKNPFNDGPHGMNGTSQEFGSITCQGAHSLSAADIDGDGCQEIVYGSAAIDHDGTLLYSSTDVLPQKGKFGGFEAKLGHGDALHVADIDPNKPGLEIFMCHEGGFFAPYGYELKHAATGVVAFGEFTGHDTGRCMIGDIEPEVPGLEVWSEGKIYSADGKRLFVSAEGNPSVTAPGTNFNIKWAADLTTQIVDGTEYKTPTIETLTQTVLTASDTMTNNGTKGTPCLVADILGDFREELLVQTKDSSAIRMYMNTDITSHKLYTLMHDPQYRAEVARQNTGYNQPSYTSFYYASDMDWSKVPL